LSHGHFVTANPTGPDLGSNPGDDGGIPATDHRVVARPKIRKENEIICMGKYETSVTLGELSENVKEKIKHNTNHNAVVNSEIGGTNLATVDIDWNIAILEALNRGYKIVV
jgi:hypothetical protein